jgi:hypothetical protein
MNLISRHGCPAKIESAHHTLTETSEPNAKNMKTPAFLAVIRRSLPLLALACVLHGLTALAQTPQYMTYQGYLTDQNGAALGTNGPQNYDIVFRIWNQPTGGTTPLYGELQTVTVANGYFSVLLGQGTAYVSGGNTDPRPPLSTVFTTNNLTSTSRYVEMTVKGLNNGADVTILPRLQLVTTPYAFVAASANALVSPTTGNTLVSSSGTNVTIAGSIAASSITANSVTATTLSANTILGNLTDSGGSIYMDNSALIWAKNASGVYENCFYPRWNDNVTYLNYGSAGFNIRNDNSVTTMWMGNNGYVGVGTTAPSAPLHVSSGNDVVEIASSSSTIGTWFDLQNTSTAGTNWDIISTGSGNGGGAGQLLFNTGSSPFSTVRTVMSMSPSGNVGIDTLSPSYPLDVNGIGRFSGGVEVGNGITTGLYGDGGNVALRTYSGGAIYFQTYNGYSTPMYISPSGLVGIGTTSPAKGALDIESGGGYQNGANPAGFLGSGGAAAGSVGAGGDISLWASGWVFALEYVAYSDARVKNIKGQSDSEADLKTLMGIKVTDFTYRDTVTKGNGVHKKVVAQQVEQVFPQAVTQCTNVVPDIYKKATMEGGWIQLATDLKVGERVKLITEKQTGIFTVLEVRPGAFRTDYAASSKNEPVISGPGDALHSGLKGTGNEVFVYGREVSDFRSVDYDAISMLNVSATQELAKRLEKKSEEVTQLEQEVTDLKKMVSQLAAESKRTKVAAADAAAPAPDSAAAGQARPLTTASRDQ